MAVKLGHERLAEAHHFVVALALRVEVRATLAAAHGQRSQGVLEDLFEGEELEDADVHRRMEAQTTFVWADGAVHLDAEPAIDLHAALVVDTGYPGADCTLRLDPAFDDRGLGTE